MKISKSYMIHYLSNYPFGFNFDRKFLESQSYEYIAYLYNRCIRLEPHFMGTEE